MNRLNITPSQQQILTQFLSITQTSDTQEAYSILNATQWNIETALIIYHESNPDANERLNFLSNNTSSQRNNEPFFPGGFPGMSSLTNDESGLVNPAANDRTRSFGDIIQSYFPFLTNWSSNIRSSNFASLEPQSKLVYIVQWIIYFPVLIVYYISSIIFIILVKFFPIIKRLTANRVGRKSEPIGLDPIQTATEFIDNFQRFYDHNGSIDWFEGGYSNALYLAKRDARFFLCYLHSEEHEDTDRFIRDIIMDQRFTNLLNEHNVLLWGGDVEKSEAYQVSNALELMKYPALVLLSLKTTTQETPSGTTTSSPKLCIISRIQGLIPSDKAIRRLKTQIEKLEPTLISIRTERQQAQLSRMIREQQDQAYQESLAKDQARERAKREELLHAERKKLWLEWKLSQLKSECQIQGQMARIAVRLPSGERIQRCFNKFEDTLEDIYTWVELNLQELMDGNEPLQSIDYDATDPGFDYLFRFNLNSMIPRMKIDCDSQTKISDCQGVCPNGNLVVEFIS